MGFTTHRFPRLTLSADLLQKALNVTPADSAHPFESPPAGKTDITFTRRRRWIIASQDETTGPSVHPEDATSTKMVGSNSKQSHVALAGPNPEHMQDVSVPLFPSYKDGKVRSKCENKGIVPIEMELALEYTQQGDSHEVSDTLPILLSFTNCGNKTILRVLHIILVILLEHPSETKVFHNEDGNPDRANIKQAL
ncbi:hypothetical protein Tco_0343874, partial [Tanacetum coccineum]